MSKPKLFITGGSGLLGLNWAAVCKHKFDTTLALNNRVVSPRFAETRYVDLLNESRVDEIIDAIEPEIIIHTAGLTSVEDCQHNPEAARLANVETTRILAASCAKNDIKYVHISTDHLFNGESAFADEGMEPEPLNEYARSKADGEKAALDSYSGTLVARTNFFGWGPSYRQSFSDVIINDLRACRPVSLFSDVFFNPILVEDLIEKTHKLVESSVSGIFNIVGRDRVSKYEFGMALAREFELQQSLVQKSSIADNRSLVVRPRDMSLSIEKVTHLLGRPGRSLENSIKRLMETEKDPIILELRNL